MKAPRRTHFDVFNGDADGLCALQQLRLAEPRESVLITGAKHDHGLLARVMACPGDSVTVLDLPVGANEEALFRLLSVGVSIEYFDHHHAPRMPEHMLLRLTLDPAPKACTSLLVDRYLTGRFSEWAVVGTFGDNLSTMAEEMARSIGLDQEKTNQLKVLGESLNYNAYGESEADLTIPPAQLRRAMAPFADPLAFMCKDDAFITIAQRRVRDIQQARDVPPLLETDRLIAILLPNAAWARRVIGLHANHLANRHGQRFCAVFVPNGRNSLSVRLRAPEDWVISADRVARRHGGDGLATAASINDLPIERVALLLRDLQ